MRVTAEDIEEADADANYQGRRKPKGRLVEEWEAQERAAQQAEQTPAVEVRKTTKEALRVLEVPEAFWGPKPRDLRFEFEAGFYVADVRYGNNNIKHFGGRRVDMTTVTFNVYGPDGVLTEEKRQAPRYMFERLRVRTDFLPDPSVAATDPTPEVAVQASTLVEAVDEESEVEEETLASRNARFLNVDPLPEEYEKMFGRNLAAHFHGWRYMSRSLPENAYGLVGKLTHKGIIYEVRGDRGKFSVRPETLRNEKKRGFSRIRGLAPDLTHYPEKRDFDSVYEAVAASQAKIEVLKHEGFLLSSPAPWVRGQAIGELYIKPNAMTGMNAEPAFKICWMGQNEKGEDVFRAVDPGNVRNIGPNTDLEVLFIECRRAVGVASNPDLPLKPKFHWEWSKGTPNEASRMKYNQGGVVAEMTLPDGQIAYRIIAYTRSIDKRFVVRAIHPLLRGRWGDDRACDYLRFQDPYKPDKPTAKELCEQAISINWYRLTER